MQKTLIIVCAIAAALAAGPAHAAIANLGFEAGTAGWSFNTGLSNGTFGVVGSFTDPFGLYPYNYTPQEGSSFLFLGAGIGDQPVIASRSFTAAGGEIIQGSAAFASGEESPPLFFDWAAVRITGNGISAEPFRQDVIGVDPTGYSAWVVWSWTAPQAGTYLLEFMVTNDTDAGGSSYAVFDAAPVPLPPSVLLLAPGLVGLWGLRRKFSR